MLRPGGRAAILDSDWGTLVVEPGDADVLRRVSQSFFDGSPNPFSGRRLRGLLRTAGLHVDADVGSSSYVLPQVMLRDAAMAGPAIERAIAGGTLTPEEAEGLRSALREAADRGTAFMAVTMFAVVARR